MLAAFGAGDLVPYVGPALQGALDIVTFGAALWSYISHHKKSAVLAGRIR